MELDSNNPATDREMTEPFDAEDDDDFEYMSTDVANDIQQALDIAKAQPIGSFEYSTILPSTPHPGLNIEGAGAISLPLTEDDAKRIKGNPSSGSEDQTIVTREVRDTWEIGPEHIKFENSAWTDYVEELAIQVCKGLGVTDYSTPPRADFYKLSLYGTGSHFLPHKDTPKADGMFATMDIILPSKHTGGEVHLTHAMTTNIVDFAQSTQWSLAVLAWYTDVLHEVKAVTSGYRLVLSYNLIHTSPTIAQPIAPEPKDLSVMTGLRTILEHWKAGKYDVPYDHGGYVGYLLKHQYSATELGKGLACLKGEDAHLVSVMRHVAEGLDYMFCLANVKCHIEGEDRYIDMKKHQRTATVEDIIDLDGSTLASNWWFASAENLIPRNASEVKNACKLDDDFVREYTAIVGQTLPVHTPVEFWCNHSVFMFLPKHAYSDLILLRYAKILEKSFLPPSYSPSYKMGAFITRKHCCRWLQS